MTSAGMHSSFMIFSVILMLAVLQLLLWTFLETRVHPNVSVERIIGGDGNDIIDMTSPDFVVSNMEIQGNDSADVLWGNDGNDILDGGLGSDILAGGRGSDLFVDRNGRTCTFI